MTRQITIKLTPSELKLLDWFSQTGLASRSEAFRMLMFQTGVVADAPAELLAAIEAERVFHPARKSRRVLLCDSLGEPCQLN